MMFESSAIWWLVKQYKAVIINSTARGIESRGMVVRVVKLHGVNLIMP